MILSKVCVCGGCSYIVVQDEGAKVNDIIRSADKSWETVDGCVTFLADW